MVESRLPSPELWLAALQKRGDAFLVILGLVCQRELVDERQSIDRQLGHGDRQRRLSGDLGSKRRGAASKALSGSATSSTSPIHIGLTGRDALVSQKSTQRWWPMCEGQRCHPGPVHGHAETA